MATNIKPRFQVEKRKGKQARTFAKLRIRLDDDGKSVKNKDGDPILLGGFDYIDEEVDAGWMVYFPSGSSIHVWTEEEMVRQGFMKDPTLVNMDTGDDAGPMASTDLKALSEQKSNRSKSSKVAQM